MEGGGTQVLVGAPAWPSSFSPGTPEAERGLRAKAFGARPFSSAWHWVHEPQTEVAASPLGHAQSAASTSPGGMGLRGEGTCLPKLDGGLPFVLTHKPH